MNTKTIAIFAGAASLCALAIVLSLEPAAQPGPSVPPPPAPPRPPVPVDPQSGVTFGAGRVQAQAQLSQSRLLSSSSSEVFLNVDLRAAEIGGDRQDLSAALVIDRSGSMAGAKIDNAREAALSFLSRLADSDQIALISYGSDVTVDIPLTQVGTIRERARRIISRVEAGGGTNISEGLRRAIHQLGSIPGARRVVLISDGRPTEGEMRVSALGAIAATGREQGLSFSAIGVGIDYNEDVMEHIAVRGGGFFYHLRHAVNLTEILAKEFRAIESLVATNVRLRIDPGTGITIDEVFGYDLENQGNIVVVQVGDLSSGEQRRVVARATARTSTAGISRFAGLGLSYTVPHSSAGESASAALSVAVTGDASLVHTSQNAEVVVAANKVQAAAVMRQSMAEMAKGHKHEAVQQLTRARAALKRAASVAPASAKPMLEFEESSFGAMQDEVEQMAPESEEARDFTKERRAKAFSDQRR